MINTTEYFEKKNKKWTDYLKLTSNEIIQLITGKIQTLKSSLCRSQRHVAQNWKSSPCVLFFPILLRWQHETGCATYERAKKLSVRVLCVGGRVILKWMLKAWSVRVWTGLSCYNKVPIVRSCKFRYEISGSIKLGYFPSNKMSQYYYTRLLKYRVRHKSVNTPLSHERLVVRTWLAVYSGWG
jgi:hypothetical protein